VDANFKLGYLMGLNDGMPIGAVLVGPASEEKMKELDSDMVPAGTYGETMEAFDLFYKTPENRELPVHIAVVLYASKTHGVPPDEYQRGLSDLRRYWSNKSK
jgi:hypothetical protein